MIDIVRTTIIDVDRHAVWAVLADFANISAWAPNVDHSSYLVGGIGANVHGGDQAGADQVEADRVGEVRRVQAGRNTFVERVTVWESNHLLTYVIEGLPPVLKLVRNRWELHDNGPQSCLVSLTTTIDAGPRPPQKAIANIVARRLAKQSDRMLSGLETYLRQIPTPRQLEPEQPTEDHHRV
jgi:hypothetical protein